MKVLNRSNERSRICKEKLVARRFEEGNEELEPKDVSTWFKPL